MFLVILIHKIEFYILFLSAGSSNMQKSPGDWAGALYSLSYIFPWWDLVKHKDG